MGKLLVSLEKQLNSSRKKDAQDCIAIYNKLKEIHGSVWETSWRPLVHTVFTGHYPNNDRMYVPTTEGYVFLEGLVNKKSQLYTREEVSKILLNHTSVMFEALSLKPYPKETLMSYTKQYIEKL